MMDKNDEVAKELVGIAKELMSRKARDLTARRIQVYYEAVDGFKKDKSFSDVERARDWAKDWIGDYPELGTGYAVSGDGIGRITVDGISIQELFQVEDDDEMYEGESGGSSFVEVKSRQFIEAMTSMFYSHVSYYFRKNKFTQIKTKSRSNSFVVSGVAPSSFRSFKLAEIEMFFRQDGESVKVVIKARPSIRTIKDYKGSFDSALSGQVEWREGHPGYDRELEEYYKWSSRAIKDILKRWTVHFSS